MIKIKLKITLFLLAGWAVGAHAQNVDNDEAGLDALFKATSVPLFDRTLAVNPYDFRQVLANSGIPSSQVSFYVQPVSGDAPLVAQNASRAQNPASTIKLVTSYAALKTFGADYQWRTELLSEGQPDDNGVLSQPLYLKGSGDPQLVVEKVQELIQGLSQSGVKELRAPIVIDRSIFKEERQDAASFDEAPSMPYNAQPDAALMNFHAISFNFDPVAQTVDTVPKLSQFVLNNNVQWIDGACPADGWKSTVRLNNTSFGATTDGRYYSGCGAQQWHIHAYQMSANDYAQGILAGFMPKPTSCCDSRTLDQSCSTRDMMCDFKYIPNQLIWQTPNVQSGITPSRAVVLAGVSSNSLSAQLKDMNHYSNNVMARQVYLDLSAKTEGQGSLNASARVVNNVLAQQGLSTRSLAMGNGSGLSRVTAISAQDLGLILVKASNEAALYDSLPIIGISGTVKNRLKDTDMVGRGRIKTGTLNDVRAIAGYIDGKSGVRYAVVSIIQGASAQTVEGRRLHDVFMQWVGEQ